MFIQIVQLMQYNHHVQLHQMEHYVFGLKVHVLVENVLKHLNLMPHMNYVKSFHKIVLLMAKVVLIIKSVVHIQWPIVV